MIISLTNTIKGHPIIPLPNHNIWWIPTDGATGCIPPSGFLTFFHGLLPDCNVRSMRVIGCVCPAQGVQSTVGQRYTRTRQPFLDTRCAVSHCGHVGANLPIGLFQSEAGDPERRLFDTYGNVVRRKGPLGPVSVTPTVMLEREIHGVRFAGGLVMVR